MRSIRLNCMIAIEYTLILLSTQFLSIQGRGPLFTVSNKAMKQSNRGTFAEKIIEARSSNRLCLGRAPGSSRTKPKVIVGCFDYRGVIATE